MARKTSNSASPKKALRNTKKASKIVDVASQRRVPSTLRATAKSKRSNARAKAGKPGRATNSRGKRSSVSIRSVAAPAGG